MTFMRSCQFGVQPRLSLLPAKPKPAPTEGWAEMAAREGHRKGVPHHPQPGLTRRERVLTALAERGPMRRGGLYDATHTPSDIMRPLLAEMLAEGLIREDFAKAGNNHMVGMLSLTDAGRAKVAA